jgi:hypothetical protein
MARTICVGPFRDEVVGRRKIQSYITRNCGDVMEQLDIEPNEGGFLAFLRFKETCGAGSQARSGCSIAYDFTSETVKRDFVDEETGVRPAIFNGVLWIGEFPRRKVWNGTGH